MGEIEVQPFISSWSIIFRFLFLHLFLSPFHYFAIYLISLYLFLFPRFFTFLPAQILSLILLCSVNSSPIFPAAMFSRAPQGWAPAEGEQNHAPRVRIF